MQTLPRQQQGSIASTQAPSRRQLRLGVVCAAKQQQQQQKPKAGSSKVEYGANWYEQTRAASKPRSVREEIAYRKAANAAANGGKERKDLYTDNWDGSEYKGSPFNILTVIVVVSVLVPAAGLIFAFNTYGVLWG